MSPLDVALECFEEGYGCSQAVLGAYAPALGLEFDQAMRLAAPFAAPLCPDLCGALSGALMVLGLALGTPDCVTVQGRAALSAPVDELNERFRASNGSYLCGDIVGVDLRTPEGMQRARDEGLIATRCVKAISDACQIVDSLLARPRAAAGEGSRS
jgi:C_GCAxxG_C_C family probable redox protein